MRAGVTLIQKSMQRKVDFYSNLGYWFLLFILLTFTGFYYTYFANLFTTRPIVIHIHFVLMTVWIAMLIVQPFLIKYKKKALHRTIGKWSYVLVPLVLLFAFLVIRLEYYTRIADLQGKTFDGEIHLSKTEILRTAAYNPNGLFFFFWFGLFYLLAIVNRRKSSVHSRYMLATALTLLGPTVDRIVQVNLKIRTLGFGIPALVFTFLLIDTILILLLIKDYRARKPLKTLAGCLCIYISCQIFFYLASGTVWWGYFYALIMKP